MSWFNDAWDWVTDDVLGFDPEPAAPNTMNFNDIMHELRKQAGLNRDAMSGTKYGVGGNQTFNEDGSTSINLSGDNQNIYDKAGGTMDAALDAINDSFGKSLYDDIYGGDENLEALNELNNIGSSMLMPMLNKMRAGREAGRANQGINAGSTAWQADQNAANTAENNALSSMLMNNYGNVRSQNRADKAAKFNAGLGERKHNLSMLLGAGGLRKGLENPYLPTNTAAMQEVINPSMILNAAGQDSQNKWNQHAYDYDAWANQSTALDWLEGKGELYAGRTAQQNEAKGTKVGEEDMMQKVLMYLMA